LSDLRDRGVDLGYLFVDSRGRTFRQLACSGLKPEADGEQSLDDVVVQVAGDPSALVQQRNLPPSLLAGGAFDGSDHMSSKGLTQFEVALP
jgi:hypothetical protein